MSYLFSIKIPIMEKTRKKLRNLLKNNGNKQKIFGYYWESFFQK